MGSRPSPLALHEVVPDLAEKMKRAVYGTSMDAALIQPVIDCTLKYGTVKGSLAASDLVWTAAPATRP